MPLSWKETLEVWNMAAFDEVRKTQDNWKDPKEVWNMAVKNGSDNAFGKSFLWIRRKTVWYCMKRVPKYLMLILGWQKIWLINDELGENEVKAKLESVLIHLGSWFWSHGPFKPI